MDDDNVVVSGFGVQYLNGDDSYLVTISYRDNKDPTKFIQCDQFSFSTQAKLKKFIKKYLLTNDSKEEEVEEVTQPAGN